MMNGTVNQCSGVFTDSGGLAGSYGDNESFTLTICPDTAGDLIQLDFTSFSTQTNADIIEFFNGTDATAPSFGQFSGGPANSPNSVVATSANTSGCITITFISDASANTTGWEANISCITPCQTIISQIDSSIPAPNADNFIRVCVNEEITLNGSAAFTGDGSGASYEWDLDNGNTISGQVAVFSYDTPGVYEVNLNVTDSNTDVDPMGCTNNNLLNQVIQVSTLPSFNGTQAADAQLCFGESTTIEGLVMPTNFSKDCTPVTGQTTALPDGNGQSYDSSFIVDGCFDNASTITDGDQVVNICLNIEHSYTGDLDIVLISPTGQQVVLFNQAGGGTYLGAPFDDPSNQVGVGADYCFSMLGTDILANAGTITAGVPAGNSYAPGTYLPVGNFDSLIGSPLNGEWTISITDNIGADDGTFFSWYIDFDPSFLPPDLSFTPAIVSEAWDPDPTITSTVGNQITVAPTSFGLKCYTYRVTDDFGCEYTQEVCVSMADEITAEVSPSVTPICSGDDAVFQFSATPNSVLTYLSLIHI